MSFKKNDGQSFTPASAVSTTDSFLINHNGFIREATIQQFADDLGFVTSVSVDEFMTCAEAFSYFVTPDQVSAVVASAVSAYGAANHFLVSSDLVPYLTSASAETRFLTKVSSSAFVKFPDLAEYITSASASALIVTITNAAGYITSASASVVIAQIANAAGYITSASASAVIVAITNAAGYITSASASAQIQAIVNAGGYMSEISADAKYLTKVSSSAFAKTTELSVYLTSASADALYLTKVSSSAFAKTTELSVYLTSASAESRFLTKTSSSAFTKFIPYSGLIDTVSVRSYTIFLCPPINYTLASVATKTSSGVCYYNIVCSNATLATSVSAGTALVNQNVNAVCTANNPIKLQITTNSSAMKFAWTAVFREV